MQIVLSDIGVKCKWQYAPMVRELVRAGCTQDDAEAYATFLIADKEDNYVECPAEDFLTDEQFSRLDLLDQLNRLELRWSLEL